MKLLSNEHYVWIRYLRLCHQKKFHAILSHNGTNHLIKKEFPCETDQLTHIYTFILRLDATYNILNDNVEKQTGSLYTNYDMLPQKTIKDPEAKKRLRCKVDFQALVFVPHIRALGNALVSRLRHPSDSSEQLGDGYLREVTDTKEKQGSKKFVAQHLRFDKTTSTPTTTTSSIPSLRSTTTTTSPHYAAASFQLPSVPPLYYHHNNNGEEEELTDFCYY